MVECAGSTLNAHGTMHLRAFQGMSTTGAFACTACTVSLRGLADSQTLRIPKHCLTQQILTISPERCRLFSKCACADVCLTAVCLSPSHSPLLLHSSVPCRAIPLINVARQFMSKFCPAVIRSCICISNPLFTACLSVPVLPSSPPTPH